MESFNLMSMLKIVGDFGTVGLVIYLWWSDNKRIWAIIETHRVEIQTVLAKYTQDMDAQREMYRANASLCRDFASVASDLREIVTLNIQKMTEVEDAVRQNQFCPLVRVDKQKVMQLSQLSKDNP